ncbi:hypothetical protein BofuT4_P147940.1 [Botrytis cinerea T4]|uniref:Methyltransferase domain-containing protein n=1 Tax=Botryotinia fuckeliana (strain T4) TaxID=999810 RepID=G2YXL3_BOTF4|nr:hypothetical protein BofuT4_P147940.1 [Botrytis cinerea T4]
MSSTKSDPMKTGRRLTYQGRAVACLKNTVGIPSDKVREHVDDIRDKAWNIRQYPCTGMAKFLDPMIVRSPAYPEVLSRLKEGQSLLDVGCFMGYDLRQLIFDGAPSKNSHAADIVNHWELGYQLFNDREKFHIDYVETDILSPGDELLQLRGKIDIISVTHVLHQWNLETQLAAAIHLSLLTKGSGSLIIGFQAGGLTTKTPESWKRMWESVGEQTGTLWETQVRVRTWEDVGYDPKDTVYMGKELQMLEFVVTRKK